ncbi:MAG TPA: hypothetical protein VHC63_10515 [Acidimicrobiales bacterium]|nr:hypothetical protein [Acidimicrobiales bacterium]
MSRSTFAKGLVVAVAAMLVMGAVIGLLNHGTHRPEGIAENWLTAVSDTTRKGVEADARKRAEKIGPPSLARGLVYTDATAIKRKAAFDDLEVGQAVVDQDAARVGFRVHARRPNDKTAEITGVLTLRRRDGTWLVTGLQRGALANVPKLPSDGGPPPSSAPVSLWLGALVGAAVLGLVTTSFVRLAGRGAPAPATA